LIITEGLTSGK